MKAGHYEIILADPPWRFQNWSMSERAERGEKWARANGRSCYDVMDTGDIAALPVHRLAAKNCMLFCWATYPKLTDALQVIAGWGFQYKTCGFTWVKTNPSGVGWKFGLGYWTRQNPELCLIATRGKPQRICNKVANLVVSPVGRHSAKPPEVRERIVQLLGPLPRIELFARERADGWEATGNELDGLDIRDFLNTVDEP